MSHVQSRCLRYLCCLGLCLAFGCNDHDLAEFAISVQASTTQRTTAPDRRPVDILFMVDNSNSMCEEQRILVQNFNQFIEGLAEVGADFQIAVINTDATEPTPGAFRTRPGTYNAPGCVAVPATDSCNQRNLPADGIIRSTNYADLNAFDPLTFKALQDDFNCLALTGIDGNGTEMGLETMRQALLRGKDTFLRPNALLALVFVTDENDCSDGTLGLKQQGDVYRQVRSEGSDRFCELSRNIEDSCTQSSKNFSVITHTYEEKNAQGEAVLLTESRSGLEWCALGNRAVVEALAAKGELEVDCPPEGCTNQLLGRKTFYDFLTTTDQGGLGKRPEDIIVASIINQDFGERYDADDVTSQGRIPPACGRVDTLGYRYEQLAQMFPGPQRVVGAICEAGKPKNFAEDLGLIADTIGAALNYVCLEGEPATCTADGVGGALCPVGQICCPSAQLCGRRAQSVDCAGLDPAACDAAKQDNKLVFLEGTPHEYRLCSGFRVVVSEERDGARFEYQEGPDFTVNYSSRCGANQPLEISFTRPPSRDVIVTFPTRLGRDLNP